MAVPVVALKWFKKHGKTWENMGPGCPRIRYNPDCFQIAFIDDNISWSARDPRCFQVKPTGGWGKALKMNAGAKMIELSQSDLVGIYWNVE